ncbi:MAG: hypothetical protein AAGA88_02235 [Pseudomonadota bacterium]
MGKAVAVLLGLATIVHMIKPLGLPGLKTRRDAWKIAVVALATIVIVAAIRPT